MSTDYWVFYLEQQQQESLFYTILVLQNLAYRTGATEQQDKISRRVTEFRPHDLSARA